LESIDLKNKQLKAKREENMQNLLTWACLTGTGIAAVCLVGCATMEPSKSAVSKAPFGATPGGETVDIYTLRNANGVEAKICNYGGIVVSLKTADKNGNLDDVVLGYDTLAEYIKETPYFGCLVGRYGNRIAKGKFALNGKEYTLATNNYPNALHGGLKGFDKVVWGATPKETPAGPAL